MWRCSHAQESVHKEVWIVLHNYDPADGKSSVLEWYYMHLFNMLRKASHGRFKVIAVSPFWKNYFKEEQQITHTYLFPNLFHNVEYDVFRHKQKNPWVHLGQYSSKNDTDIFRLAGLLHADGYFCYFSTLNPDDAMTGNGSFDICYFEEFSDYLDQMSRCCCTLALTQVNEGWNRVAHESILVGTPVIGYARAGLGDLLRESNSMAVKNIDEAYTCIRESLWVLPDESFANAYDIIQADIYLRQICRA